MGHLDIHDDEVGRKAPRGLDRLAAVAHRLGFIGVGAQKIAEQLQVQFVVLDNEDFLSHALTFKQSSSTLGDDTPGNKQG